MIGRSLGWLRANAGRGILDLLLLSMAAGQLADPGGFVDVVSWYRIGGRGVAVPVAAALVVGETTAGAGLLLGDAARRRWAGTVAVVVAVAWSLLGVQAFVRGLALDNCGCFGVYLAQSLRWWVLLEDAEFVAGAVWVRRGLRRRVFPAAVDADGGDALAPERNAVEA